MQCVYLGTVYNFANLGISSDTTILVPCSAQYLFFIKAAAKNPLHKNMTPSKVM